MVLLAVISLIAYIVGLFLFAIALYYYFKKSKEQTTKALRYSFIALSIVVSGIALSIITNDPIPYFNVLMILGVFTFAISVATIFPSLIANEVKKELVTEEKIHYRKLSENDAKVEITEYLKHKKGDVWIEDIINDLKIEPEMVVRVIKEFHKNKMIKETN